ncbi:MAG: Asp-tRNA(Asn)/Glu-tRNA(Gln) amidotransferase GatCAB subunit C [Spirochaetaceae bacterium]|jgi:aspartyl-tRNA(Asn)/glutamyl-tRNA(Gln) amidotransferase subunit C|nr:Asp-tRNA(Asn)/Glu-tRNA(Gln) amidotransferase GatCAB subunit C [Spirochaetaceae bacterium]
MEAKLTIDERTLDALLYLSRLSPESANLETLREQANQIVGYFDILAAYDDSENPYDAYPTVQTEELRGDGIVPSLNPGGLKRMTGEFLDGYFRVPKVLGEGV